MEKIKHYPAIIHLMWSNDIAQWLNIAKALVLPSYREGLANVLLEAAAMHCLLLVSSIDGNLNIVPDEAHGVLFEPCSVIALYNAMVSVSEMERSDMKRRTQKAFKIIAENYSQSKVHAQIAAAYQRLLGS
jgi:glycosyltransferase involved in cell wall biosynthesis